MQILQVTDPAIIAEALRSKDLDKRTVSNALNYFAGPHALPTLLTNESNERWKAVRYLLQPRPFQTCQGDLLQCMMSCLVVSGHCSDQVPMHCLGRC